MTRMPGTPTPGADRPSQEQEETLPLFSSISPPQATLEDTASKPGSPILFNGSINTEPSEHSLQRPPREPRYRREKYLPDPDSPTPPPPTDEELQRVRRFYREEEPARIAEETLEKERRLSREALVRNLTADADTWPDDPFTDDESTLPVAPSESTPTKKSRVPTLTSLYFVSKDLRIICILITVSRCRTCAA